MRADEGSIPSVILGPTAHPAHSGVVLPALAQCGPLPPAQWVNRYNLRLSIRTVSPLALKLQSYVINKKANDPFQYITAYPVRFKISTQRAWQLTLSSKIIADRSARHTLRIFAKNFGFQQRPTRYWEIIKYEDNRIKSYPLLAFVDPALMDVDCIAHCFASLSSLSQKAPHTIGNDK